MTEERAKRKLSGIFSADAVGYSRLMQEDEASTIRNLEESKRLMSELIEKFKGRVVDAPGDNLLAEFGSVVDATECAVKIQQELKNINAPLSENRKMEFRIGVNLGDVVEEAGRIYGDGVNIAARLEKLAEPGGICISRTAYDHVKTKLKLGFEYLGENSVKNIAEPVRVYRVLMEPEAAGKVIGENRFLGRVSRKKAIAAIICLAIVAGGLIGWNIYLQQSKRVEAASLEKMVYPLPDRPSIAVLPFTNMTRDSDQDYFSDGITENIITALSYIRNMFVIARNSTFTYKGKPVKIQQVAEELGVQYVLEGGVQKTEDRVRITAQLIDALSGRHLWAERYDRKLKDIFDIQDDITKKIITEVQVQLTAGEQARLRSEGTKNLDAYLAFLQGWEASRNWDKESKIKARRLAEKTIALDPNYQNGYFLLSVIEVHDIIMGLSKSPKKSLLRAIELAEKSIKIADSPPPHRTLAVCYMRLKEYERAIAEAKKAIELGPNYADAYMILGHVLCFSDMAAEAIPVLQKAIRLNPYPPSMYYHNLAFAYFYLDNYEEAIAQAKLAIYVSPLDTMAHRVLIACYSLLGRETEAHSQAAELLRIDPDFSVEYAEKTAAQKNKEKTKKFMDALRKAGLK